MGLLSAAATGFDAGQDVKTTATIIRLLEAQVAAQQETNRLLRYMADLEHRREVRESGQPIAPSVG